MVSAYQFIKFKEEKFKDFHKKLSRNNIYTCFDLEDNIIDFKLVNTNKYKEIYREKILKLIKINEFDIDSKKFCICINDVGSFRYYEDIETLRSIKNLKLACIFIPKVNDSESLSRFLDDTADLTYGEFIPIIETNDGFRNIDNILSFDNPKFKQFGFGHCDYNLSCNIFPFVEHDNPRYWRWIKLLAGKAEKYDKKFINSPYLELGDVQGFIKMLDKMSEYFKSWGQVCFNTRQSLICSSHPEKMEKFSVVQYTETKQNSDAKKRAKFIVDNFEKYNHEGSGFSIIPQNRKFISPQEYVIAKRFLYDLGRG